MKLNLRDETTPRGRKIWARSIERLIGELDRPQPLLRSVRPLYRRDVAAACVPALTEIRWVLLDDAVVVRPEAMARFRDFMTDGGRSPLYRDDPEAARRAAHELASAFVVPAATHATKTVDDLEIRGRVPASSARA